MGSSRAVGLCAVLMSLSAVAEPIPAETVPKPPERPVDLTPAPPPEPVPVPPQRPAELTPVPSKAEPAPAAGPASPSEAVPVPPQRPAELTAPSSKAESEPASAMPVPPPTPPERPADLSGQAALSLKVAPPDDEACRIRLKRLGVSFEPLPPIAEGQCTAPLPLKITTLADGVSLQPAATLTCRAAEGLARWATEVQVAAQRSFGHPLTALEIGGSYVCRGQNHDVDAKLSEHAFANGVDVMGFVVTGRAALPVRDAPSDPDEASFLKTTRSSACEFFRTVLGPGSNAAHANHFHLDERERTAGHRLCE